MKSGVITAVGGSSVQVQQAVAAADPKISTVANVAIDGLRELQVPGSAVIIPDTGSPVNLGGKVFVMEGGAAAAQGPIGSLLDFRGTIQHDDPSKASSPIEVSTDTGSPEWDALTTTMITPVAPSYSVSSAIKTISDLAEEHNAAFLIVLDQTTKTINVYQGADAAAINAAYNAAKAAVAEVAEFTRADVATASSERQYGE